MISSAWGILSFLLLVCLIVGFHEWGHYVAARFFGMGVEEFAIGMGPGTWTVFKRRYRVINPETSDESFEETAFNLRPLPIGGFVRIKGLVQEDPEGDSKLPGGFYSKPAWNRWLVLFAGPLFSFILGILMLCSVWLSVGLRDDSSPIIGSMIKSGPAYMAGIRPADRIVSVNGKQMASFLDIVKSIRASDGHALKMIVDRRGQTLNFEVTPVLSSEPLTVIGPDDKPTEEKKAQYQLKASAYETRTKLTPGAAIGRAVLTPFIALKGMVNLIIHPSTLKDNVSGVIGIAQAAIEVSDSLYQTIELGGVLSISLGMMNLLPIPPLDGGQMLFAFYEMVRKKRLSTRIFTLAQFAGLAMVFLLMITAVVIDVQRLVKPKPEIAKQ